MADCFCVFFSRTRQTFCVCVSSQHRVLLLCAFPFNMVNCICVHFLYTCFKLFKYWSCGCMLSYMILNIVLFLVLLFFNQSVNCLDFQDARGTHVVKDYILLQSTITIYHYITQTNSIWNKANLLTMTIVSDYNLLNLLLKD